MTPLSCPSCRNVISIGGFLENCWNSKPAENLLLFLCPSCGETTPFQITDEQLCHPGSSQKLTVEKLKVFTDPTYGIDCILEGKMYHMPRYKDPAQS